MKGYRFFGAIYFEKDNLVFFSILGRASQKSILTIEEIKTHPLTKEVTISTTSPS